jgi:beta-lactamase class D
MPKLAFAFIVFPLFLISCTSGNVSVDDSLQRYFDSAGVKGTFGLFDNGHGHFTICNLPRFTDSFFSPGATFDILQSLIAIQTGIKKDDSAASDSRIPGQRLPGVPYNFGQEFRDTGVFNRLAFMILSQDIGYDTLKRWIDSLRYGNKKFADSATFWEDGDLGINGDQQLGLLKKLYFNQLPFFERTQGIVRRMMASEITSSYRFFYKTAMVRKAGGESIGWAEGWVEENKHPYFFVVNVASADPKKDLQKTGLEIAKKILVQQGFFGGKR